MWGGILAVLSPVSGQHQIQSVLFPISTQSLCSTLGPAGHCTVLCRRDGSRAAKQTQKQGKEQNPTFLQSPPCGESWLSVPELLPNPHRATVPSRAAWQGGMGRGHEPARGKGRGRRDTLSWTQLGDPVQKMFTENKRGKKI